MTPVIGDITVSLDGFVTGPGADLEHGLGLGADGLHAWALDSDHPVDRGVLVRHTAASGAVVMGRKTFDTVDGVWSAERGYGADQDGRPPFFVVTSRAPVSYRLADSHDFIFVLDGPAAAIERARTAADDRDVFVMGGGALVGRFIALPVVQTHELSVELGQCPGVEGIERGVQQLGVVTHGRHPIWLIVQSVAPQSSSAVEHVARSRSQTVRPINRTGRDSPSPVPSGGTRPAVVLIADVPPDAVGTHRV